MPSNDSRPLTSQGAPALRPLRLYDPDQPHAGGPRDGIHPALSLTDFFEQWVAPIALRRAAPSSVAKYRDTLAWWTRLTGDPPLEQIDDFTLLRFEEGLARVVWRRSPKGRGRPLAPLSRHGHLVRVNTLLTAAGPRTDRRRPAAGILPSPPQLEIESVRAETARPFGIEQARAIYAAIDVTPGTRKVPPTVFRQYLRALIAILYYTGIRTGTAANLTWDHVAELDGEHWLQVPDHAVSKTAKGFAKLLHPSAFAACARLRTLSGERSRELLPCPHGKRWVAKLFDRVQQTAGIDAADRLSLHAWRRTHATEIAKLGAANAYEVAQRALHHATSSTTRASYVDLDAHFIRQLPRIEPNDATGQRWLF